MDINSRNSKTLRDDVAYNLIHADYLIRDAITLLKIAAGHIDDDMAAGIAGPVESAKRKALDTAINYASLYEGHEKA
jgi:hypothetical protein